MLRVRDIMTTDVVTVSPDLSIREAMELFSSRHLSGAPVVEGKATIGVISATDLLAFAAALPGAAVARAEQAEPEGIDEEPPPVEGDDAVGRYYADIWAAESADVTVRVGESGGPEWNVLDEHTVSEAMTRAPLRMLAPETPVTRAADLMRRAEVHRVLVGTNKELLGIVTTTDIARAVADGKLTSHTLVFPRANDFDERGWETT